MGIEAGNEIVWGGRTGKVAAAGDAPWGDPYLILQVDGAGTPLKGYAPWVRSLGARHSLPSDTLIILLLDEPSTYTLSEPKKK